MVHVNSSKQSTKFSEMKSLFSEGFINFVMRLIYGTNEEFCYDRNLDV